MNRRARDDGSTTIRVQTRLVAITIEEGERDSRYFFGVLLPLLLGASFEWRVPLWNREANRSLETDFNFRTGNHPLILRIHRELDRVHKIGLTKLHANRGD